MIKLDQEWEKARTALGLVYGALPHEAAQIETYIELLRRVIDGDVFEPNERAETACESIGEENLCGQCADSAHAGKFVVDWETDVDGQPLFFKPEHAPIDGVLPDGNNGERAEGS